MLNFIKLNEDHLGLVLSSRTHPDIAQYMLTEVENNLDKQKQWFKTISDHTRKYWVISYDNQLIGLICLLDIDDRNIRCNVGYYIGDTRYRALGGMILPYLYNYVFYDLKFLKIYGELIEGNSKIMALHKMHGYRHVGTYEKHILKEGRFLDVILVELMKSSWDAIPKKI